MFSYVQNDPINRIDPLGLASHDPQSSYCKALKEKIQNIQKDLDKRYKELQENPNNLPWRKGPHEKLRESQRGHQTIINKQERRLRELQKKYDDECKPNCEEPKPEPSEKLQPSITPDQARDAAIKAGIIALILYLIFGGQEEGSGAYR